VRRPLDDALTSSWVLADPSPSHLFTWMKVDRQYRFADVASDTCVPDAAPARPPFTPTVTLFGALRRSVFEARCCLPTSATAYDVRTPLRDSRFLAGTMAMTTFLF